MKMIGMLIVLGFVLFLVYTMAEDMGYLTQGEGDKATLEAVGVTGDVMNQVDSSRDTIKKRLEEIK